MNTEEMKLNDVLPESASAAEEPQITPELVERMWRPQDADRFEFKETVRKRVRNSQSHPNAIFRPAKPAPAINDPTTKKVGVYARVSTKSKEQVSSIENQQKYYTKKISDTPNWDLVDIYADEGISGTSVRKRKRFLNMIDDAVEKKMNLIVCASVSRFARNLEECLKYIDILRTANPSHPVGVYFETENIYTLDPNCSQQMYIHAMLADWESANKSRRMILSYDQRICTGQYPVSDLLGYRHTEDGELVIQEDEAITVRFIFLAYVLGYTCAEIAEVLTEKARPTLRGNTVWNSSMVSNIMKNERRWGDLDVRKTIVIDYKHGITKKNDGERDSVYIPGYHTGIVTPEIARAAKLVARSSVDGVSDIGVIEEGALKGFVSIPLGWNAVDIDTLQKVCRSVYDSEELHTMEREARILSGLDHSNVLSIDFTGYQVPYGVSYLTRTMPSITISPKSISVSRACHTKLDGCEYVELLYHPILQMIAIRPCAADDPCAIHWVHANGHPIPKFGSKALASAIYESMQWKPEYQFRFRCITKERNGAKVMFVSLDEPQVIPDKKTKAEYADLGPVQYIPYKIEPEEDTEETNDHIISLVDAFGLNLAMRKRRDHLANNVTGADITKRTQIVDNPMIGKIPTRAEVAAELEDLLLSM